MAAVDDINRTFREFTRYTGDGLPGAPTNAPLPVGDPQSGVHHPKKSELRSTLGALVQEVESSVSHVNGMIPAIEAARDDALVSIQAKVDEAEQFTSLYKDAYEVAVSRGFVGTVDEWLASLEGPAGDVGPKGDRDTRNFCWAGSFDHWQRGTSIAGTAARIGTADGWTIGRSSGATGVTVSQQQGSRGNNLEL